MFSPSQRWNLLGVILCGVTAMWLALHPFSDVDYHWHLTIGRYVAEHGFPPMKNLWSFTAPEHEYPPTAWLFGWLIHVLWVRGGDAAVHGLVALLAAASVAITFLTARRLEVKWHWALSLSLCGALMSEFRYVPRPHMVSYVGVALTLHALVSAWQGRRWPCFFLPVWLSLWSNFHAGAIFGLGLVGISMLVASLERLRKQPLAFSWKTHATVAVASSLALLANPSGLELSLYAAHHLQNVKNVVVLTEFMMPAWSRFVPFWAFFGLTVLLAGRQLFRGAFGPPGAFWALSFATLAARAVRVVPKFLLVSLPFLGAWLSEAEGRVLAKRPRLQPAFWALTALLPLGVMATSENTWAFWWRPMGLGVLPRAHPVALADWVKQQGISGRCFASWDVSGFVEHRLPESPVYLDPRLSAYPASVFHDLEAAENNVAQFDALMRRYDVEWAFRGHSVLRLSGLNVFTPDRWALVAWDEAGQVLLRRDVERFSALIAKNEFKLFRPGVNVLDAFLKLRDVDRTQFEAELERMRSTHPRVLLADLGACLTRARRGDLPGARTACNQALEVQTEDERLQPGSSQASLSSLAMAYMHLSEAEEKAQVAGFSESRDKAFLLLEQAIQRAPQDETLRSTYHRLKSRNP